MSDVREPTVRYAEQRPLREREREIPNRVLFRRRGTKATVGNSGARAELAV
jgi:hypothetical protein